MFILIGVGLIGIGIMDLVYARVLKKREENRARSGRF